ncbi:MAG TPA: DUF503 domain-containing protein [Candidatus Eisenbacteria bacterium]
MSFFVGVVRVELFIPQSRSLKDKRSVLHGVKDRLKALNAAVAEVDGQDLWQRATLAVSLVSSDSGWIEKSVQDIRRIAERDDRALVSGFDWDVTPAPW